MKKIGFIGLGHMGMPMALGLLKSGYQVQGFDMNPELLNQFQQQGGNASSELIMLAKTNDVLITMLPTAQSLLEIYDTKSAFIQEIPKKTLIIDCSTVGPIAALDWHQIMNKFQLLSVDAPVSGGVIAASQGELSFMLGGEETAVSQAETLLKPIGKKFIKTGSAGSGQAAKICNNLVLANNMLAVSEAFLLAKHLSLAPEKLLEVLECSSGNSWVVEKYLPVPYLIENVPANHDYQAGFSSQMMLKDLNLALQSSQDQVKLELTKTTQELFQALVNQKLGNKDFSVIYEWLTHQ